jgi:hypothetical protein
MRETISPSSRRRITSIRWLKPWVTKLCEAEPELEIYLREGASDTHHFLAIVNRALARTGLDWRLKDIAHLLRTQPRK